MRGSFIFGVTLAVLFIIGLEWRGLKHKLLKEKAAFAALLLLGWLLCMLDLPNTQGPTTLLKLIFKPFKGLVEQ